MPENWVKGFFQLFLGRPRITRVGKWLAKNSSETYEKGWARARPADAPE